MGIFQSKNLLVAVAAALIALFLHGCGAVHTAVCGSNEECGSAVYECVGGICVLRECTRNEDCDQSIGEFCHQEVCSQFCSTDSQCGTGNFCVSNVCFAGCDVNTDCDQENGFICDVIPNRAAADNEKKSCLPGTPTGDCLNGEEEEEDNNCLRCATDDEQSCAACQQGYDVNDYGECQAICQAGEGWVQGYCCPTSQIPPEHWVIVDGVCTPLC